MASKESTDMILDLLYDELTPEESLRAQKLIAQDDDLQAEFNRLQATRSEFHNALPAQPVPSSVHDAIMAAAAKNLNAMPSESTDDSTKAPPPLAPRPPQTTIWPRIANISRAQFTAIATVAVLLLTSAVLWRQISPDDPQSAFQVAASDVTSELAFDARSSQDSLPTTKEEAPPMAVALKNEHTKANEPHEFETAEPDPEPTSEPAEDPDQQAHPAPAQNAFVPKTKRESAPMPQLARKTARSAPEQRRAPSRPASARSVPARGLAKPAEFAPPIDFDQAKLDDEITTSQPLQDAEKALANREFSTAITRADQAINNPNATPDMRARALHIQALAYTQQGYTNRAEQTYKTLQAQHPTYRSDEIARARTDLAEKPTHSKPAAKPANIEQQTSSDRF